MQKHFLGCGLKSCGLALTLLCLTLLWLASPAAHAATLNVPGNYNNIADAVAGAGENDEIIVAAGTYNEASALYFNVNGVKLTANGSVTLNVPAAADSAIFIGANVTGIVLTGLNIARPTTNAEWMRCTEMANDAEAQFVNCSFSGPGNGVGVILFNGADANFKGCTFGNFNPVASWAAAIALEGNGGSFSNVTVEDCTFAAGCNRWLSPTGATLPKIGALTFRRVVAHAANHPFALYTHDNTTFDASQDLLFEDCTFEGTTLEAAEFHYTPNGPRSFIMRRCTFKAYDSLRKVMWYDLPTPATFENVVFAGGKHETLIRFWGGAPSVEFKHCTLVNDGITAAQSNSGINSSTLLDGWDGGRTFIMRNCLLYSPTNYSAALQGDAGSSANRIYDIDYSIIDHGAPSGDKVTLTGGTHYSNRHILFTNAVARDYSLNYASPGMGEGTDLGVTTDVLGNPRPNPTGSAPEMGAYESVLVPVELSEFSAQ